MDDTLRKWVERTVGATVVSATRRFTGGSRELWFIDVDRAGTTEAIVLRVETGAGAFAGTDMSLEREAVVYRALGKTEVPVPALLGMRADGTAMLLERIAGSSSLRDLEPGRAETVLDSFIGALGALHGLDVDSLDLPGFVRPRRPEDHALVDLGRWRSLADEHLTPPDPMLAFAFSWLAAHPPCTVQRTVLVQGDTGPGNFVAHDGAVTGLVDWEFSHLGDPMDDIAWLDMRIAGSGLPSDPTRRDRPYEHASGLRIDPVAVCYYAVFVQLRCAVTTGITIARGGGAVGLAAYHAPNHRFLVQLGQALADVIGAELDGIAPVAGDDVPDTVLYDHAIDGLVTDVLPSLVDARTKLRTRAAILTLEHLRTRDRLGALLERLEMDDRRTTFGHEVDDDELLSLATEVGARGDETVLGLLFRRAQRHLVGWATPSAGESISPRASVRHP